MICKSVLHARNTLAALLHDAAPLVLRVIHGSPDVLDGNGADEGTASALPEPFVTLRMESVMVSWAAVFLVIALVAALMGFTGIAGMSMNIAWILFIVGMVFAIVLFAMGRRRRA